MLTSYRRVLALPGTLRFSATGLVARLPISMVGLGIVLLLANATGSYGVAGSVSAAYLLTNAALAITQGRLVDRLGQARVLVATSVIFTAAMLLMLVAIEVDWPLSTAYLLAALAGGALPAIGSCVRARWSWVLTQPADVQTAYAIESVGDEVVFILGPIVVTVLATTWSPVAGLLAAVVAGLVGTLAFAAQRGTQPPAHAHHHETARPPMPWDVVIPLAVVSAAMGTLFGAAEVATVAFAGEHGGQQYAGGLLALWALGSFAAGLVTGAIAWQHGPADRVRWGAVALCLAMVPLFFVHSLAVMGLVLLLAGSAISPTLIGTNSLIEQVVPAARLTEGMGIMQTGLIAGVAPGAALGGLVIDAHGASAAYLVSVAAGALAAVAAQALRRTREPAAP